MTQREKIAKKGKELKTIKVPTMENGSKLEHQYLKEEGPVSTEKKERRQSPIKLEQKELVQSKKIVFNLSYHLRTRNPLNQSIQSSKMFVDLGKTNLGFQNHTIL